MQLCPSESAPLDGDNFDLMVVGGGINGVAIAREAARAGRRTLLVEQNDFGSGTSSRSTRIIHGGLRYLEQGEIGLVRESLLERERLLAERPHLVRPMQFLLVIRKQGFFSRRNSMAVRAGLALYKRMARANPPARSFERTIDAGDRFIVLDYEDAQCEFPERLIAEWLGEAIAAGAVVRNHTEVLEITIADGAAKGAILRDGSGRESRVRANTIINAAGPWVDRLCAASGLGNKRLVGGVRGSHILLPRFDGAPKHAIYSEARDGRPTFILPWNGQVLVGTTEVRDDSDPDTCQPSSAEIAYLFCTFKDRFPNASVHRHDILAAFAGIRPLPYQAGGTVHTATRRHLIHDHAEEGAQGLYSIVGGKLTTAARLARDLLGRLGIPTTQPLGMQIAASPHDGIESALRHWSCQMARQSGVAIESTRAIAEWHGRAGAGIVRSAAADERLRAALCPHTPHVVAEAVHAFRHEAAHTLGDILLRRVPIALGACWSSACTGTAAARIGAACGWNERRQRTEAERFEAEYRRFFVKLAPRSAPAEHVA